MSSGGQYSTPKIHQAVLATIAAKRPDMQGDHLDIGSGDGSLIHLLDAHYTLNSCACDYTDALMQLPEQQVDVVDLNLQQLPYPDDSFDLVTFTEVIEHVENHYAVLRDIRRVLKPGGIVVITTPNILNLKSRLRFLFFGFWSLFGPLQFDADDKHSVSGHINPLSYFYLCHSLFGVGLKPTYSAVDKVQRSSLPMLALLWLPIRLLSSYTLVREEQKYDSLDEHNRPIVQTMNGIPMLLGRTIIVVAEKTTSSVR